MATVREFIDDSYQLISAHNPTVPLHGNDLSLGIKVLNRLLQSYAATGLLITIAKEVSVPIEIGQDYVVCGPPTATPTPDITIGRLANLNSAWIELDGVTYPLIYESRDEFLASYRYEPLKGLPRFIIVLQDTNVTRIRLYPAPSQQYMFTLRGKFQLSSLTSNDDMSVLPEYFQRYLQFASAKDIAMYKGRSEAWTPVLESMLVEAKDNVVAASEVNVAIVGDKESLLNGAWRVKSGV